MERDRNHEDLRPRTTIGRFVNDATDWRQLLPFETFAASFLSCAGLSCACSINEEVVVI